MHIWTGRNRLPRCHCRKKSAKDGPQENQRCSWLESPHKSHRNRQFLGFTGYDRYFILNYSKIAWPLLDLTKKATVWQWTDRHFKAFEELKTRMCQQPVLIQPDFQKCFYLQVHASAYGLGAVLLQEGTSSPTLAKCSKPVLHPIAYYSATFTPTECNYDIYEWELLAVMSPPLNSDTSKGSKPW